MGFWDWFYTRPTTGESASSTGEPVLAPIAATVEAPTVAPDSIAKASARPAGTDGVVSYGGFLSSNEQNGALAGSRKWLTYNNAINEAVVATGVRYFGNLLAGTKWHAEPNEAGGSDAERGVDVVTQGLLTANMGKPWSLVVRKAAMYRLFGFSLHATGIKRRKDGLVVYSAIEHRPQHTIEKWHRKDERSPWESVSQRTKMGTTYSIDLDECFYCVDDTLTDSPDGVGLLRHVIELVRRLGIYQGLEGIAYQSDMGGLPIGRAPIGEIAAQASTLSEDEQRTFVQTRIQGLIDVIQNRIKTPEAQQYLLLDSATYQGRDPNTISGVQKWALDLLTSATNGLAEIDTVIKRIQFEIARVLGIEFALVGAEGGSYSMHEDKTSMFATNLQVTLAEMGAFATQQLARRLVRLNGLDPDTATPRLVAEPISTESVLSAAQALQAISNAALHPKDPARAVLRSRMQLPPEPDDLIEESMLAPRLPFGGFGGGNAKPDEDAEDVDDAPDETEDDPDTDDIDTADKEPK